MVPGATGTNGYRECAGSRPARGSIRNGCLLGTGSLETTGAEGRRRHTGSVSRSAAFLVGLLAFVAFVGLYAWSWIAAFGFLALWLAATVLYRRRRR